MTRPRIVKSEADHRYRTVTIDAPDGQTRAALTVWSDGRVELDIRESGQTPGRVLVDVDYTPHHETPAGPTDALYLRTRDVAVIREEIR